MAHQRTLIRTAVVALLTDVTAAGARVSPTRVEPHKKTELPALSVYTLSETVEIGESSTAPRELTRSLKLEIAGWVAHSAALPADLAMDDLALQIETAMDVDPYLAGLAGDSILESTEMMIRDEGDPLVGIVTLVYSVTYRTYVDRTEVVTDFLRAGVTTQIDGAGSDNAANNLFDVRTP